MLLAKSPFWPQNEKKMSPINVKNVHIYIYFTDVVRTKEVTLFPRYTSTLIRVLPHTYYHYFDQQSSLSSFIFEAVCKILEKMWFFVFEFQK